MPFVSPTFHDVSLRKCKFRLLDLSSAITINRLTVVMLLFQSADWRQISSARTVCVYQAVSSVMAMITVATEVMRMKSVVRL